MATIRTKEETSSVKNTGSKGLEKKKRYEDLKNMK